MPCIRFTTNVKLDGQQKQAIREGFMKAITIIPGKKEDSLMVIINDSSDICFHRTDENPSAFVEVNILLRDDPTEHFRTMSGAIFDLLRDTARIEGENIYIRYTATKDWAWNGINF